MIGAIRYVSVLLTTSNLVLAVFQLSTWDHRRSNEGVTGGDHDSDGSEESFELHCGGGRRVLGVQLLGRRGKYGVALSENGDSHKGLEFRSWFLRS